MNGGGDTNIVARADHTNGGLRHHEDVTLKGFHLVFSDDSADADSVTDSVNDIDYGKWYMDKGDDGGKSRVYDSQWQRLRRVERDGS